MVDFARTTAEGLRVWPVAHLRSARAAISRRLAERHRFRAHVEEMRAELDRRYIAAARTDVPALLDEVERLTKERDKWKKAFEEVRTEKQWLMLELFDAKEASRAVNVQPVLHENAQLKVRAATAERERDEARDEREQIRGLLELECERVKTLARECALLLERLENA